MKRLLLLPLLALVLLGACKPSSSSRGADAADSKHKPQVLVANYPLQYFAQRLAGDAIEIKFPAPADEDPAFWQPDEGAIAAYQNADLILMNGATFSKWAEKATLPASKIVDTSAGYKGQFIEIPNTTTHSHGPAGTHSHSGTAFTTWIDFQQAQQQVQAIRVALAKKWPNLTLQIEKNYTGLSADLIALDARMLAVGQRIANAPIVASHPVYHYWARRYGINLKSVLWEPETVPDDKAMQELNSLLGSHAAKWMIWEGEPAPESVAKLAAIGIKSVVFDPCGNVPEKGDFMNVMKANVEALEKAFSSTP
jgi:zinc transport system substrate-binding protein